MSLLHRDSTLDAVLHAITKGAPRCTGNCNAGRKPCTMPGVCTLPQRCRAQVHADTQPGALDDTPGDARATRWLLAVYIVTVAITLWLIAP